MSQQRDDALIEKLLPDFFHKHNPGAAWMHAVSIHLALPALRALWTMSSIGYIQPECTDVSGQGNHLATPAAIGDVVFGYGPTGYPPTAYFWGLPNCYLFKADGGGGANWADTGTIWSDFQILDTQRGLTLGGWFWWPALPGAWQHLMSKDDLGANRQYALMLTNTNQLRFELFPGPTWATSTNTINVGWNHCIGIYDRTTQNQSVVLNGIVATNVGGAPAALADSAAPFTIGADGAGGNRFTGYASLCWLQACSMYQAGTFDMVRALYHFVGPLYVRQE